MKGIYIITLLLGMVAIIACNTQKVDKKQFAGKWQYQEKSNFKGMILNITCVNDTVVGTIDSIPPDSKLLNLHCSKGQKWLMDVERKSINMFECKEARPASDLLGMYGQPGKTTYKMQLVSDSIIGLSESGDPLKSKNYLRKIQ
jgi:hypothetical protein